MISLCKYVGCGERRRKSKVSDYTNLSNNIDAVLCQLNTRAYEHENSILQSHSDDHNMIEMSIVQELLKDEMIRLGSPEILRIMEGYILAMIYGFSVTPTDEEGDILQLLPEHIDLGRELLHRNNSLWGTRVFPLLLYGSEYLLGAQEMFSPDYFQKEKIEIPYNEFIDILVRTALQMRYKHFVQCETEDVLGNLAYRTTDFSGKLILKGRLLNVETNLGSNNNF